MDPTYSDALEALSNQIISLIQALNEATYKGGSDASDNDN
jgi:hypothetical protein